MNNSSFERQVQSVLDLSFAKVSLVFLRSSPYYRSQFCVEERVAFASAWERNRVQLLQNFLFYPVRLFYWAIGMLIFVESAIGLEALATVQLQLLYFATFSQPATPRPMNPGAVLWRRSLIPLFGGFKWRRLGFAYSGAFSSRGHFYQSREFAFSQLWPTTFQFSFFVPNRVNIHLAICHLIRILALNPPFELYNWACLYLFEATMVIHPLHLSEFTLRYRRFVATLTLVRASVDTGRFSQFKVRQLRTFYLEADLIEEIDGDKLRRW